MCHLIPVMTYEDANEKALTAVDEEKGPSFVSAFFLQNIRIMFFWCARDDDLSMWMIMPSGKGCNRRTVRQLVSDTVIQCVRVLHILFHKQSAKIFFIGITQDQNHQDQQFRHWLTSDTKF